MTKITYGGAGMTLSTAAVRLYHADLLVVPTKPQIILTPPIVTDPPEFYELLFSTFYFHSFKGYGGFSGASSNVGIAWNTSKQWALPPIQISTLLNMNADGFADSFNVSQGAIVSVANRTDTLIVYADNGNNFTGGDARNYLTILLFYLPIRLHVEI